MTEAELMIPANQGVEAHAILESLIAARPDATSVSWRAPLDVRQASVADCQLLEARQVREYWRGRPVYTQEELARMPCPFGRELDLVAQWEAEDV